MLTRFHKVLIAALAVQLILSVIVLTRGDDSAALKEHPLIAGFDAAKVTRLQVFAGDSNKADAGKPDAALITRMSPWSFFVKGSAETWQKFLQPIPPPTFTDLYGCMSRQHFELGGDIEAAFAHYWALTRMLDALDEVAGI